MKIFSTILFLSFTMSTYSLQIVNASSSEGTTQDSSGYGEFSPVIPGIPNDHREPGTVKILWVNALGTVAFNYGPALPPALTHTLYTASRFFL